MIFSQSEQSWRSSERGGTQTMEFFVAVPRVATRKKSVGRDIASLVSTSGHMSLICCGCWDTIFSGSRIGLSCDPSHVTLLVCHYQSYFLLTKQVTKVIFFFRPKFFWFFLMNEWTVFVFFVAALIWEILDEVWFNLFLADIGWYGPMSMSDGDSLTLPCTQPPLIPPVGQSQDNEDAVDIKIKLINTSWNIDATWIFHELRETTWINKRRLQKGFFIIIF